MEMSPHDQFTKCFLPLKNLKGEYSNKLLLIFFGHYSAIMAESHSFSIWPTKP